MRVKIGEITAIGIFSALAFAGGYLFIAIPNVEVFTAIVFLSGMILGSRNGLLVGLIAQSLYSLFNPFGISPPPLFVAQVLNRILVGYVGGRFQFLMDGRSFRWTTSLLLGGVGLGLTWLYDLMTDYSFFFVAGFSWQQMQTTFALGLPFYLVHGAANTAIFGVALPFLIAGVTRFRIAQGRNSN